MTRKTDFCVLILAAGKGTRMKSSVPKSLQLLAGMPMLFHILKTAEATNPKEIGVVVGHQAKRLEETVKENAKKWSLKKKIRFIEQKHLTGSGTAIKESADFLKKFKQVLVLCGDTPLFEEKTLKDFVKDFYKSKVIASVLTMNIPNPKGYGRIIKDKQGYLSKIVEESQTDEKTKRIQEVNSGVYFFDIKQGLNAIKKLKRKGPKKEYFLTDTVEILNKKDKIKTFNIKDFNQAMGINSKKHLAIAEKFLRQRTLEKFLDKGVNIIDVSNTYIDGSAKISADATIYPGCHILGKSKIASGAKIGPNAYIENSEIGKNAVIKMGSYITDSKVGATAQIGPYAHLRPESDIRENVKIGNFTEVKKSVIGKGSKVPHLSYVGDSTIGTKVNVGAGTITCNYDGKNKHKTIIEDEVFVGSNVNFVAPIKIGKKSVIGAGSTITEDVPANKLVIARSRQIEKKKKGK